MSIFLILVILNATQIIPMASLLSPPGPVFVLGQNAVTAPAMTAATTASSKTGQNFDLTIMLAMIVFSGEINSDAESAR